MSERKPRAWMRRWAFDGEQPPPRIVMGKRVRMPGKFKLLPVTLQKCLPDDVPLYADADGVAGLDHQTFRNDTPAGEG